VLTWGETFTTRFWDGSGIKKVTVSPDPGGVQPQLTSVKVIYSNHFAFAAKKADDSVVTWGLEKYGGDSSGVDLTSVETIFSNHQAFAALKKDKKVVTWGASSYGGTSADVQPQLTSVDTIFSSGTGFAAKKKMEVW